MKSLTYLSLFSFAHALRLHSNPGGNLNYFAEADLDKNLAKNDQTFDLDAQKCITQAFADILFEKKIPFFPFAGTLLQLYRDGHVKESDGDIDVAIYAEDWPKLHDGGLKEIAAHECVKNFPKMREAILNYHMDYIPRRNKEEKQLPQNFQVDNWTQKRKDKDDLIKGYRLDVWFLYKTSPGLRSMCVAINSHDRRVEEYPEFTDVRSEAIPGMWNIKLSLPTPTMIESVLESSYGLDWKTPVNQARSNTIWLRTHDIECPDYFSKYNETQFAVTPSQIEESGN